MEVGGREGLGEVDHSPNGGQEPRRTMVGVG